MVTLQLHPWGTKYVSREELKKHFGITLTPLVRLLNELGIEPEAKCYGVFLYDRSVISLIEQYRNRDGGSHLRPTGEARETRIKMNRIRANRIRRIQKVMSR